MPDTRTLLITIPDDDTAEHTVQYVAQKIRNGNEIIALDYDPIIPKEEMPKVIAKLVAYLRIQETHFRVLEIEKAEASKKAS